MMIHDHFCIQAFMLAALPAVAPMAVSSTTTQRMGATPNFLAARL